MRYTRLVCALLVSVFALSLMAKKPKDKNKYGVYMVGVSASFKDSLVYFTDVQFVDSAAVDGSGFLVQRQQYSEQLHDFMLEKEGKEHRTCFVLFNAKEKSLIKELSKLKEKYNKNKSVLVKEVDGTFKFKKAVIY